MVIASLYRLVATVGFGATLLATSRPVRADVDAEGPALHHAPLSVARPGESISIVGAIDHPELVKSAFVVYRTPTDALRQVPFQRASSGPYVAIIPPEDVRTPSIAYTVELELVAGERRTVFASRDEMQPIEVPGDIDEGRERAAAERLGGRRSVVTTSAEYVVFGQRREVEGRVVADRYWRTEAAYTYRPLRSVAEFGIRAGVVRGPNPDPDPKKPDLGLNYGAPSVRFRLGDIWHLEGEFLSSVTEVGFSVGTGAALLIGDPYGSKLTLGFETIQVFGTRLYSRMDIAARRDLVISPIVEVTDMPHADRFGVRLLTEARFDAGKGFGVGFVGGYQARVATSGGPTIGLRGSYAF
ncbi:MAG TPA: hypothetical protein VK540_20445 [Polyangiaceae bacterium]|jgi:hypothetical protein|nr:hypothetical protein [Polyangiaceae bacterium]